MLFADSVSFFDVFDTVSVHSSKNLFDTTVLAFKFYFSNHKVLGVALKDYLPLIALFFEMPGNN